MPSLNVKYVTDADGNEVEVIVPIAVWRAITSARNVTEFLDRAEADEKDPEQSDESQRATATYIDTDALTGLPVFIAPPGSPTLTLEDVKKLEDEW